MAFSVNALTEAGNNLLVQASAANPIVYIYALGSTYSFTAQELAQMDDVQSSDWDITNGFIVASSATNNTARIIAGFANQAASKVMKTVAIVGRLQSQSDSQAIVVAAVSDDNASIRIPALSEPPVRIEVALNITISDIQSVVVTSSTAGSAMLSDLDRLVSCHSPGQPYSGEDQTIYGVKTFRNSIKLGSSRDIVMYDGNITWDSSESTSIAYVNNATYLESIEINANTAVSLNANQTRINGNVYINGQVFSDLIPMTAQNLGANGNEWDNLYCNHIVADDAAIDTLNGAVEITSDLSVGGVFYPRGGLDFDELAPLDNANFPLIPRYDAAGVGNIFLAIISSPSVYATTSFSAGDLISAELSIAIANSEPQATGGLLTPQFSVGYALTNTGSNYRVMNTFQITGNKQVLALVIRVE